MPRAARKKSSTGIYHKNTKEPSPCGHLVGNKEVDSF